MKKTSLLWPLTIIGAYGLGYWHALPDDQNVTKETNPAKIQGQEPQITVTSNSNVALSGNDKMPSPEYSETSPVAHADFLPANIVAEAKAALGNSQFAIDFESLAGVYNLIEHLTEDQLEEILRDHLINDPSPLNSNLLALFISQYASFNPRAALDFIEANITHSQTNVVAVTNAVRAWTKTDPEAAFEWYQSQILAENDKGLFNGISSSLPAIFDGLARQDIDLALSSLGKLEGDGRELNMALMGLANAMDSKDQFAYLLTKTSDLKNKRVRSSIIRTWGSKKPEELAQWLDNEYLGDDADTMREDALASWMLFQPEQSADWYMQSSTATNRQDNVKTVIENWSMSSPQDTLEWLRSQRDIDFDDALTTLIESAAFSHRDFAINNIELLDSAEKKVNVSYRIYLSLRNESEEKAMAFVNQSEYRDELLKDIAYLKGNNDG